MNRHEAYGVLAVVLEKYRRLPLSELSALVGSRRAERIASTSGEEFILELAVEWAGEPGKDIRVRAKVDSPSCFRLERLEDEVLVSGDAV